MEFCSFRRRQRTCQCLVSRFVDRLVDLIFYPLKLILSNYTFLDQNCAEALYRIPLGVCRSLLVRPIEPFIIGERMGVGSNNLCMNEGRTITCATIGRSPLHYSERFKSVGAVAALQIKIRKVFDQTGNIAARSLHFDRHADRVAVIFKQEKHRQLEIAGGVERFPKLAFAGRSISQRNVGHFVFLKV